MSDSSNIENLLFLPGDIIFVDPDSEHWETWLIVEHDENGVITELLFAQDQPQGKIYMGVIDLYRETLAGEEFVYIEGNL